MKVVILLFAVAFCLRLLRAVMPAILRGLREIMSDILALLRDFGAVILQLGRKLARKLKPRLKGWYGEALLHGLLRNKLDATQYRILLNIMLPTADGTTTQIDHIVISQWGIFVIETKTYSGWIFGDAKSPQWTVSHYRRKHRFQNPLRQNYKHLATLSECLGIPFDYFKTVIAFSGEATFKTEMPPEVLHFRDVPDYILRQSTIPLIPPEQVPEVESVILEWQQSLSRYQKSSHVRNLRKTHPKPPPAPVPSAPSPDTPPACPKCGAPMVRRTRRSDGGTFWGCSRYPSCRGIHNT